MNRYESVMLDRMLDLYKAKCFIAVDNHAERECEEQIFLLLGCINDARNPQSDAIEDGCGQMVGDAR